MRCAVAGSDRITLYFYGELSAAEQADLQAHLRTCGSCRTALDEMRAMTAALAAAPFVSGPPEGDWSRLMHRLEDATGEGRGQRGAPERPVATRRAVVVSALAMAALLMLVTSSVTLVLRGRNMPAPSVSSAGTPADVERRERGADAALLAVSGQHFQRSKLVLLGLSTMDGGAAEAVSWGYEQDLASNLLDDTRVYRRAAEHRGMTALAGVMRDLELVLLQTAMADAPDGESLERIQRLIRQRDLMTKLVTYERAGSGM